jgi:hypothetical protein
VLRADRGRDRMCHACIQELAMVFRENTMVVFPRAELGLRCTGTKSRLFRGRPDGLGAVLSYWCRPDPYPSVFGYHEVFRVCVCAAATCQYIAIVVLFVA